ncbi:hypothetical protein C4D60_Mb08t00970 [Musa balbisiana]|uniref:Uncharacterized protein n=1 Tax=Musa balbisiana TaxID=52838 RepID=A0A4S8K0D9_MUSBA|nr:hypothetical protein C4D60_Mb08t00970 [Musa balbisiana]
MEDVMTRYQVPAFGHWNFNFYDEISISQYFESAREAGLVRPRLFGGDGEDLFRVLSPYKKDQQTAKGKKGGERRGGEKLKSCGKQELRKPKAVDEDLYKHSLQSDVLDPAFDILSFYLSLLHPYQTLLWYNSNR